MAASWIQAAQYAAVRQAVYATVLHCVQHKGALPLWEMAGKSGQRGRRSPCPAWWVEEANRRLRLRGVTKKQLANALMGKGVPISEMMVLRCLFDDEARRIPTIEAIAAISDALNIPRPVVVAESIEQAREIESAIDFSLADAKQLTIGTSARLASKAEDARAPLPEADAPPPAKGTRPVKIRRQARDPRRPARDR